MIQYGKPPASWRLGVRIFSAISASLWLICFFCLVPTVPRQDPVDEMLRKGSRIFSDEPGLFFKELIDGFAV